MTAPARLRFALRHWHLDKLAVLDVGCGPGEYLPHFGPGSLGLDIDPAAALAAGLNARAWNFTEPVDADIGQFDAVWCSNIIEHVMSPHALLIDLRRALRPHGRVFVAAPHTMAFRRSVWHGFLHPDHVGFFTPRTLKLTIERAGYSVDFMGSPSFPRLPRLAAASLLPVAPVILVVAAIRTDFQYADKAYKRLVDGHIEWK